MTPIDLTFFAEQSQKLPSKLLTGVSDRRSSLSGKLFIAHLADYFLVLGIVMMMTEVFGYQVKLLMVTKSLRAMFSPEIVRSFSLSLIPFAVFNYFFFSYLLNAGQSWGLYLTKKRVDTGLGIFSSLKWAAQSTLLCFSCGLWYFLSKGSWSKVKNHDYLYDELVSFRESHEIDLFERLTDDRPKSIHETGVQKVA